MKLPTIHKLHSTGFAHHFLLPVLAVLVVGGIGAYVLSQGHAATATSYYSSSCIKTTYGPPNSSFQPCALYAQELMNGIQHQKTKSLGLAAYAGSTFKYTDSKYYLLMNGLYGKYTAQAVTAVTGDKNGQLTSGNTGSWQALCTTAASAGLATGGAAASATLKFNLGTDTNATQTNAGVFTNACGSKVTITTTTTASSQHVCTSYTFSASSSSMSSSLAKPAPADCVRFIQTILNGTYQSNYKTYDSVADSFSSQTGTAKGLLTVDGKFGAATQSQLQAFQAVYNNLPVNGSVNSAAVWTALCGEAISFKPDSATWKKSAYQDAVNVFSGQSKPWSGCSTSAAQPTYSQHASAPTVGVPVKTTTPVTTGGGSTGSKSSGPTGSLNISLGEEHQNSQPFDVYAVSWSAQNATVCHLSISGGSWGFDSQSDAYVSGKDVVSLSPGSTFTFAVVCDAPNVQNAIATSKLVTAP